MRNKIVAFTALLAIVLVVVALQMRSDNRVADLESSSLLSAQQLEQLTHLDTIRLQRGEGKVELALQDGHWGVVSRAGFSVQRARLAALLHALRGARVTEEKTANAQYHERLGLDLAAADNHSFQVYLQGGGESYGLIYGNQVGSGQLVRYAEQEQVLLINRPLAMSVNPTDWLALNVINIPMEQVASARWTYPDGGVVELDKKAEGDYNLRLAGPQTATGNERLINAMVLALVGFTAQDVALRDDLSLAEPILQMQVTTWSGGQLDASLYEQKGRYWLLVDQLEMPDDSAFAINADKRWAYQVGVGELDDLMQDRAGLLPAP